LCKSRGLGGEGLKIAPASQNDGGGVRSIGAAGEEYIVAGEIFQVVSAQRWRARGFTLAAVCSLWASCAGSHPAPFRSNLDSGIALSRTHESEILVRTRGDKVTIRPIASGTKQRADAPTRTKALEEEDCCRPEGAGEHRMLLDSAETIVGPGGRHRHRDRSPTSSYRRRYSQV